MRPGRKNGTAGGENGGDKEAGIAWDDPDVLTVLQAAAAHQRATKQFRRNPEKPGEFVSTAYDKIKHWNVRREVCRSVVDLYTFLRAASGRARECVIRGALIDGVAPERVRRTKLNVTKADQVAAFREVPRRSLALDFDEVESPEGLDPLDVLAAGRHLRGRLPAEFHGASCVVQATSSCGIKPGLRHRLWFRLSRPLGEAELKGWLAGYPCDPSVFHTVEPIYTAKPIFPDHPADDPVKERVTYLLGAEEEVAVPDPLPGAGARAGAGTGNGAAPGEGPADDIGENDVPPSGFDGWLGVVGDGPGRRGFREPMKMGLRSYAGSYGGELLRLNAERLRDRMRAAFDASPKIKERDHSPSEKYLGAEFDRMLEWAADRQDEADAENPPTRAALLAREMERVNCEWFVTPVGGDVRVAREARGRELMELHKPAAFKLRMDNQRVVVSEDDDGRQKTAGLGSYWLGCRDRRTYDGVRLLPGGPREIVTPDGRRYFNTWQGWGVRPKAGAWPTIERHLREVICAGDAVNYEWALSWLAYGVQFPDGPAGSMFVMRGEQGTGKGSLYRLMARIYGAAHSTQLSQEGQLTGRFNRHYENTLLLFADESVWAGDRGGVGVLKAMVTEEELQIERKGVDVETVPNRLKIMVASNEEWVVPASGGDRRAFVLEVSSARIGDVAYFKALRAAIAGDECVAFFQALLDRPLDAFNPQRPPLTAALSGQKFASLGGFAKWWKDCLTLGRISGLTMSGWPQNAEVGAFYDAYRATDGGRWKEPAHVVGRLLAQYSPGGKVKKSRPWNGGGGTIGRPMVYVLPPLAEARAAFLAALNIPEWDWGDGDVDPGDEGTPPPEGDPGDDNVADFASAKRART